MKLFLNVIHDKQAMQLGTELTISCRIIQIEKKALYHIINIGTKMFIRVCVLFEKFHSIPLFLYLKYMCNNFVEYVYQIAKALIGKYIINLSMQTFH